MLTAQVWVPQLPWHCRTSRSNGRRSVSAYRSLCRKLYRLKVARYAAAPVRVRTHARKCSARESECAMLSIDLAAGGELVHMRLMTGPVAQMDRAAVS